MEEQKETGSKLELVIAGVFNSTKAIEGMIGLREYTSVVYEEDTIVTYQALKGDYHKCENTFGSTVHLHTFHLVGVKDGDEVFYVIKKDDTVYLANSKQEVVYEDKLSNYYLKKAGGIIAVYEGYLMEVAKVNEQRERLIQRGSEYTPIELAENEPEQIEVKGETLQDRFTEVISATSSFSEEINSQMPSSTLNDKIAKEFIATQKRINKVSDEIQKPGMFAGLMHKIVNNDWSSTLVEKSRKEKVESKSYQGNIDELFGLLHSQYEQRVKQGDMLQQSKDQAQLKLELLRELGVEAQEVIDQYEDETEATIHEISLHTQIFASIETYEMRVASLNGALLAIRGKIIQLGKNLPTDKALLSENVTLNLILKSGQEEEDVAGAVAELLKTQAREVDEEVHKNIESLFDDQINNTATIENLEETAKRAAETNKMIHDKSKKLFAKVINDNKVISTIQQHRQDGIEYKGFDALEAPEEEVEETSETILEEVPTKEDVELGEEVVEVKEDKVEGILNVNAKAS